MAADVHGGTDAARLEPESLISLQYLQQLRIRSGKFVLVQPFPADPSKSRAAERLRLMSDPGATEKPEVNRLARVLVRDRLDEITDSDLDTAVGLMIKHRALDDTVNRARHYGAIARDALALFPASEMKQALEEAVEFCTARTH